MRQIAPAHRCCRPGRVPAEAVLLCAPVGRQVTPGPAFGVRAEILESFRRRPGIDDLEQVLFAVLQRLGSPPGLLFAAPPFLLSPLTSTFDLRLLLSLLDEPRDFDRGIYLFVCLPIRSGGEQCSNFRLDWSSCWNRGLERPRSKQEVNMC